jgi:hypothetical protein
MRKNITVSVDQSIYRQAREWAARRDTSVSAVVQYLLERLPGLPAARTFHAHSRKTPSAPSASPKPEPNTLPASQPAAQEPNTLEPPVSAVQGSENGEPPHRPTPEEIAAFRVSA